MLRGTAWRFVSGASPEEVESQLAAALLSWRAALKSDSGAIGSAKAGTIKISHVVRGRGNAWRPLFVARIEPADQHGSIVEGRFRVPLTTRGFVGYVGLFALLFVVLGAGPFIIGITPAQRAAFVGMAIVLGGGYGLVHAFMRFRWRGIRDESWLVEFVATTIGATGVERGSDGWPNRWLRALVRGWLPAVPSTVR